MRQHRQVVLPRGQPRGDAAQPRQAAVLAALVVDVDVTDAGKRARHVAPARRDADVQLGGRKTADDRPGQRRGEDVSPRNAVWMTSTRAGGRT